MTIKEKWNDHYHSPDETPITASVVLSDNCHLLPAMGDALDLACGRGGNALLLAQQGLNVSAWDISDVVIEKLRQQADSQSVVLRADVRDVESQPPAAGQYDVIVVSYFLDRNIVNALMNALKPGGLIFYQTYSQERVSQRGPQRIEFRLRRQELLQLFAGLEIIVYREEGTLGDTRKGLRDEVMFVGRKSG